jgi:hypothetical protein
MTHVAHPNIRRIINKVFWEIGVDDVDKFHIDVFSQWVKVEGCTK